MTFNLTPHYSRQGFTLIELMLVVLITAILMLIAIPSYTHYVNSNDQYLAQQQGLHIADQLQRWRARYLTYSGFVLAAPTNSKQDSKYSITVTDAKGELPLTDRQAHTEGWRIFIKPNPEFQRLELTKSYYLDSLGRRCVFGGTTNITEKTQGDLDSCQNKW